MDFKLNDEQELLRDGLSRFLATRYDLEKSRSTAKTGKGFQPDIWRAFADELGILGATLPEEHGGIGGGPVETFGVGQSFFEPPGSTHLVSANASATEPAELIAVFVADEGAQLTTYLE